MSEQIKHIAQGNPGALTILAQMSSLPELLDYLEDFGPRGSDLWDLYKDWCNEDIETLCQIVTRMLKTERPEVWLAMAAEAEISKFAQDWERMGDLNYG